MTVTVICMDWPVLVHASPVKQGCVGRGRHVSVYHPSPVNLNGIAQSQVGEANSAVLEAAVTEVARRFDMKWNIFYDSAVKRVAIFVSKMDHCLWDLLIRHQAGEMHRWNALM